jgi:site-specific DNA-methyltransferase (adenine-specific)
MTSIDIHCGDVLDILPSLPKDGFELVFADPPFNLDKQYKGQQDNRSRKDYIDWSRRWLGASTGLLTPNGGIYIMTIQADIWIYQQFLEEQGFIFKNVIAWRNSSIPVKNRYCINYQPIIFFTRSTKYTFNCKAESHLSNAVLPWGRENKGHLMIDQCNDIPFIAGGCMASKEAILEPGTKKKAHPCQMPLRLAERIVKFSSNPGDNVLDVFMGSGTMAEACKKLDRNYTGIDKVQEYCDIAKARLDKKEDSLFA